VTGDGQAYSHLDVRGPSGINTGFWKRFGIPEAVDPAAAVDPPATVYPSAAATVYPSAAATVYPSAAATVYPSAAATVDPSATDTPATVDPSATDTPATDSPATDSPATDSPATVDPSATDSPATVDPSATDSPATMNPSATDSPATVDPSATDSPATMDPSATDSPATVYPSATDTLATVYPPATDSPDTVYPSATADPPATDPPAAATTAASGDNPKTAVSARPSARPGQGSDAANDPFAPGSEGIPHGKAPIPGEEDGGPSGDSGPNAGGFGSDPVPVPPPKPEGWTGYDDLNNPATPDMARHALEAAIKGNLKDKEAPSFTQRYDLSDQKKKDTSPRALYYNAAEYFPDFQLSTQDQYIQRFVRNQGSQGRLSRSPIINEAAFSPDGKVVIAAYSDADKDTLAPADRTSWSEFVFQQMKQYAETGAPPYDIKNLQFLVRVNVGNLGTVATIKKAFLLNGLNFDKDAGVFRASARAGTAEAAAFDAILRTENVRGVNWMLGDHHTELGDKRIKALYIYPNGGFPNIFIEVE
jgi:hypothetical protein